MTGLRIYSATELAEIVKRNRDLDAEGRVIGFAVCAFAGFVAGLVVAWWKWA